MKQPLFDEEDKQIFSLTLAVLLGILCVAAVAGLAIRIFEYTAGW